jgi:hypothetical protein
LLLEKLRTGLVGVEWVTWPFVQHYRGHLGVLIDGQLGTFTTIKQETAGSAGLLGFRLALRQQGHAELGQPVKELAKAE